MGSRLRNERVRNHCASSGSLTALGCYDTRESAPMVSRVSWPLSWPHFRFATPFNADFSPIRTFHDPRSRNKDSLRVKNLRKKNRALGDATFGILGIEIGSWNLFKNSTTTLPYTFLKNIN